MIDLLVAGGGPAGLATALYGARAGLDVAVVERRSGVLDKACGEGMMPHTVAHLDRLGVTAEGRPLRGISYIDGDRRVDAAFRAGAGRGVRRTVLHAALWRAAEAAGVKLVQGELGEISQDAESVCAAGFQARYLAAADGLHSPIRKSLGLSAPARGSASVGDPQALRDRAVDGLGRGALVARRRGVCDAGGRRLRRDRDSQLDPWRLRQPLRVLRRTPRPGLGHAHGQDRAAGPLRQKVRNRAAGRVLLVGDAAGYIDALTGEGMGLAFGAAELLVSCVVGDRPEDYDRQWRRLTRRYRMLTAALVQASAHPLLRAGVVPAAQALPSVFARLVNLLAH